MQPVCEHFRTGNRTRAFLSQGKSKRWAKSFISTRAKKKQRWTNVIIIYHQYQYSYFPQAAKCFLPKLSFKTIFIIRGYPSIACGLSSCVCMSVGLTTCLFHSEKLKSVARSQGALGAAQPPHPEHFMDESPETSRWQVTEVQINRSCQSTCTFLQPTEMDSRMEV